MKGIDFPPQLPRQEPDATPEDFKDNEELYTSLRKLPPELQNTHATRMSDMDDSEALEYIQNILEMREAAVRESVVSDDGLEPYFHAHEKEIWNDLETTVFSDPKNFLGKGQTARIKSYTLTGKNGEPIPLAIKYLLTPTAKTLSVSGEHDLIREVERVQAIERAESRHGSKIPHMRVPHPYFYYKKGKTQCYGMELVDGINLEEGIEGKLDDALRAKLKERLTGIDRDTLMEEIALFFTTMHEICIHADMKPANLMIDSEGHFYVIDFGQSVLTNEVNDKSRDAFEVLKEDDIENAQRSIKQFLDALGV